MAVALTALQPAAVRGAAFQIDLPGQGGSEPSEAVLFSFDRHSVPFRHGLQLELISAQRDAANPVLKPGGPNDPDPARLAVEILDEQFRPLPGHTAAEAEPFRDDSAFRLPVRWQSGDTVKANLPIRVRVNFDGLRLEDARVYAVYVESMR